MAELTLVRQTTSREVLYVEDFMRDPPRMFLGSLDNLNTSLTVVINLPGYATPIITSREIFLSSQSNDQPAGQMNTRGVQAPQLSIPTQSGLALTTGGAIDQHLSMAVEPIQHTPSPSQSDTSPEKRPTKKRLAATKGPSYGRGSKRDPKNGSVNGSAPGFGPENGPGDVDINLVRLPDTRVQTPEIEMGNTPEQD